MNVISLPVLFVFVSLALPSVLSAESGDKQPDRELAGELAAALTLVASESRAFASARDELARVRLLNMQTLENNMLWMQEGNDFDVRAWEVVGETYRVTLFNSVLETTNDIATRRAATAARQVQQQRDLTAAKSAVNLKTSQLSAAAGSLAALAEPPASGEAVSALVKTTLAQFTESLGEESPKLRQGLTLAEKVLDKVLPQK